MLSLNYLKVTSRALKLLRHGTQPAPAALSVHMYTVTPRATVRNRVSGPWLESSHDEAAVKQFLFEQGLITAGPAKISLATSASSNSHWNSRLLS